MYFIQEIFFECMVQVVREVYVFGVYKKFFIQGYLFKFGKVVDLINIQK